MKLNKEKFMKTEMGGELEETIRTWDKAIDERRKATPGIGNPDQGLGFKYWDNTCRSCQDMSIAGHQGKAKAEDGRINRGKGADQGSGTRSSLMWETIHIIEQMGKWKPKYVIWENVRNVKGDTTRHYISRQGTASQFRSLKASSER